jgi:hypothetical protein
MVVPVREQVVVTSSACRPNKLAPPDHGAALLGGEGVLRKVDRKGSMMVR